MNDISYPCETGQRAKRQGSPKKNWVVWTHIKRIVMWRGYMYRLVMRISHKFNWHYAPPSYPDGDTHLWCQWCGFRQTVHRVRKTNRSGIIEPFVCEKYTDNGTLSHYEVIDRNTGKLLWCPPEIEQV